MLMKHAWFLLHLKDSVMGMSSEARLIENSATIAIIWIHKIVNIMFFSLFKLFVFC
jgi:hypothetical protein